MHKTRTSMCRGYYNLICDIKLVEHCYSLIHHSQIRFTSHNYSYQRPVHPLLSSSILFKFRFPHSTLRTKLHSSPPNIPPVMHTIKVNSAYHLVCRLLLEKNKRKNNTLPRTV